MSGQDALSAGEALTLIQHLARFSHGIVLNALPDEVIAKFKRLAAPLLLSADD